MTNLPPHPIPYQGSKRRLACDILSHMPPGISTLVEPFCGSAAVSLAAAQRLPQLAIHLNDSLSPLAELWQEIVSHPNALADQYKQHWQAQGQEPLPYYNAVREAFNQQGGSARLLFLLARCVKNAVRFNAEGAFNQSPDKRRRGTAPARMRTQIARASRVLSARCTITSGDYSATLQQVGPRHLVYLDPPYEGTSGPRDRRYHQVLNRSQLIEQLEQLLTRGAHVIVSLDGRCGEQQYGTHLPTSLGLTRLELTAGRSSQATLHGRNESTVESLYISKGCLR